MFEYTGVPYTVQLYQYSCVVQLCAAVHFCTRTSIENQYCCVLCSTKYTVLAQIYITCTSVPLSKISAAVFRCITCINSLAEPEDDASRGVLEISGHFPRIPENSTRENFGGIIPNFCEHYFGNSGFPDLSAFLALIPIPRASGARPKRGERRRLGAT